MYEVLIHNLLSHQEEEFATREKASKWSVTLVYESSPLMDSLTML